MNNSYYKPCSKCNNDECVFRGSADTNELCEDFTEWIPVSEKLPKDGTYLICTDDGYIATIMYDRSIGWLLDSNIIAWMPLPQPYKGESEDAE